MAKRILIVDDEPDILKIAVFRLKKSGYEILTAIDGQGGLDSAKKDTPDLILLDLILPRMTGDEVCRRIKADDKLRHIPVILFTASIVEIQEKLKDSGAEDYLIKPFEPEELLEKIRKFIG